MGQPTVHPRFPVAAAEEAGPGGTGAAATSLGALCDLHEPPVLGRRHRTGFGHDDEVTDACGVLLVMHLDLAGGTHHLAVQAVLLAVLDLDDDGLVHLVGDDVPASGLARIALDWRLCLLGHQLSSSFAADGPVRIASLRSLSTV